MEKKRLTVAELIAACAAIALSFAAVLASEYAYGNISIGLAATLGICLVWVIYDAARLGGWWEKFLNCLTKPPTCKCGGTKFRHPSWWKPEISYVLCLGSSQESPPPPPQECVDCGELQ